MTRSQKLDALVSSVEALLAELPQGLSPEIADLCGKVDEGIFDAWTSIAREEREYRNSRFVPGPLNVIGWALLAATSAALAFRLARPALRLP